MREFYKNSKWNTLRCIVFKNKTKQLPYLRLVPRNEIRFRKSKRGNTLRYYYDILPNNEYRRLKYKGKNYHNFSCVYANFTIIKNLRRIISDKNKKVKCISLLGENRRRWYKCMHSLKHVSNKKVK